ncbi:transposase [Tenacibaculum maritimum]|nr:transposase [Tenacibaculum maritimum]MCD9562035.1 transposase [Tenacibaculum maritimum]MCD9579092.1 transposase [Tenacibaculum maritimum]MCD9583913.1 transposase [Tenacibaculum maritimum]MCD9595946.1 transposase [Tenacibaculum maritimum]MCD9614552.1 transposase [Tenacibaculum maritimum]
MTRTRKKYDKEFKQTVVDLLQSGKSIQAVCLDYDLND